MLAPVACPAALGDRLVAATVPDLAPGFAALFALLFAPFFAPTLSLTRLPAFFASDLALETARPNSLPERLLVSLDALSFIIASSMEYSVEPALMPDTEHAASPGDAHEITGRQ